MAGTDPIEVNAGKINMVYRYAEPIMLTYGTLETVCKNMRGIVKQKNKFINAIILTRMYLSHPSPLMEQDNQHVNDAAMSLRNLYKIFGLDLMRKSTFEKTFGDCVKSTIFYSENYVNLSDLVANPGGLPTLTFEVGDPENFRKELLLQCPQFYQFFKYLVRTLIATRDPAWKASWDQLFKGESRSAPSLQALEAEMNTFMQLGVQPYKDRVPRESPFCVYKARAQSASDKFNNFVKGTADQKEEMKRWIKFGLELEPSVITRCFEKAIASKYYDLSSENALKEAAEKLDSDLGKLERALQGRKTLIGGNVTFADIAVFCHLLLLFKKRPAEVFGRTGDIRSNIRTWYEACKEEPAFRGIIGSLPDPSQLKPFPPGNLEVSMVNTFCHVHLEWKASQAANQFSPIKGYKILMQPVGQNRHVPTEEPGASDGTAEGTGASDAITETWVQTGPDLVSGVRHCASKIKTTHEYKYRVVAIDFNGLESDPAEATIPHLGDYSRVPHVSMDELPGSRGSESSESESSQDGAV